MAGLVNASTPGDFPVINTSIQGSVRAETSSIHTPGGIAQQVSQVSISPRLFALIIGINFYKSPDIPPLRGPVPDANAVQNFLENDLGVLKKNLRNLRNQAATRAAIIHAMQDLARDQDIRLGDAILIYYAGHGASAPAPDGWSGPNIEMLMPYDYEEKNGNEVNGIPDRTMASLLDNLADAKGDNITVILDCCHSGSGTRNAQLAIRGINLSKAPPPTLDQKLWGSALEKRGSEIVPTFIRRALRSHVLLAACGSGEVAQERGKRGLFTKALLEILAMEGTDKLTYKELIQRTSAWEGQNPQCEGYNQSRILFNSKAPNLRRVLFEVHPKDGQYIMNAGAAHGITEGARFALYKDRNVRATEIPIGHYSAQKVDDFSTILCGISSAPLESVAYAFQTHASMGENLRVHVHADLANVFNKINAELQNMMTQHRSMVMVDRANAELDVLLIAGRVVFDVLDQQVTQFGFTRLPFKVPPTVLDVCPVIRAAASYYWHLRRRSTTHELRDLVNFEMMKLIASKDQYDDLWLPLMTPVGDNLFNPDDNTVRLVVDDSDSEYGIKLTNISNLSMFPSLFYFDNSDFSISTYYLPPTSGGKVDVPLPPGGSLTIGYGSGGAVPFQYFLRDGQDIDVGFLKLFLSTKQLDLSHIPQNSPFDCRELFSRQSTGNSMIDSSMWDTLIIPIVQTRRG